MEKVRYMIIGEYPDGMTNQDMDRDDYKVLDISDSLSDSMDMLEEFTENEYQDLRVLEYREISIKRDYYGDNQEFINKEYLDS